VLAEADAYTPLSLPPRFGNPAGGPVGSRHRQQLNGEFIASYRLTGGGPSGVLPGARELCPVAVSGAGVVAVGM